MKGSGSKQPHRSADAADSGPQEHEGAQTEEKHHETEANRLTSLLQNKGRGDLNRASLHGPPAMPAHRDAKASQNQSGSEHRAGVSEIRHGGKAQLVQHR